MDDTGKRYSESPEGERALESSGTKLTPLTLPLRPGESYTTELVFDVPPDARNLRLLITETDWVTQFLIGHENSLFHRETLFLIQREP